MVSYSNSKQIQILVGQIDALNAAISTINTISPQSPTLLEIKFQTSGGTFDIGIPTLVSADAVTVLNNIFQAYQTLLAARNASLSTAPVT